MKTIDKNNMLTFGGFIVLILLGNGHLFQTQLPQFLNYDHGQVQAGQWWRIFTYPLVHVSWYHLVLDVSATLLLWQELKGVPATAKIVLVSCVSMMVLLVSILFSPHLATSGLCGLSGLAHGLALFAGLHQVEKGWKELSRFNNVSSAGLLLSGVIIIKCLYEALSGQILFGTVHLGDLGVPIVHAHLGGALGGLSFYLLFNLSGWSARLQCEPLESAQVAGRSSRVVEQAQINSISDDMRKRAMSSSAKSKSSNVRVWIGRWAHKLLSLRYDIEISGLDEIEPDPTRGTIFLPNHPAYIDPVIVTTGLYEKFAPRPLSDADQVAKPIVRQVMKVIRPIIIPDVTRNGRGVAAKVRAGLQEVVKKLNEGEEIILYPSGKLYRSMYEELGRNSGVEYILKHAPDTRVILVRTSGLWGSAFSRAHGTPKPKTLLRNMVLFTIANMLFFGPRRKVRVDMVEETTLSTLGSRHEINRYLERYYNATAQPNTTVPLYWWQGSNPGALPEPGESDSLPTGKSGRGDGDAPSCLQKGGCT
ncbi:MAG: rhombosortase [Desulfobulbaceae bacterium]|nr:MAG: rhombosortase [Desulfobulbaceae bacterium]